VGDEIIVDPFDCVAEVRGHLRWNEGCALYLDTDDLGSGRAAQRSGGGQQPCSRQQHS
jgi:hypothetical protein